MTAIPYEAQQADHACGAACLCMAYRSLGLACAQAEVTAVVSRDNCRGTPRCWTHLLARDVLSRGLVAVIVRVKPAWEVLRRCLDAEVRVVLHHRLSHDTSSGHYSVLVGLDGDDVVLHDPLNGPNRRLSRHEFAVLWRAGGEVVGHVLLAIAKSRPTQGCDRCGMRLPGEMACPLCQRSVSLHPSEALGCGDEACEGRWWQACFCPWCDFRIDALGGESWRPTPNRSWRR